MLSESDLFKKLSLYSAHQDINATENLLQEWISGQGSHCGLWNILMLLFDMCLKQGEIDKCFEYSQSLISIDSEDAYAHSCLGTALYLRRDYGHAARSYRIAANLARDNNDPNYLSYMLDICWALLETGDYDDCIKNMDVLENAMKDSDVDDTPLVAQYLYFKSVLFERVHDNEKASACLRKLLQLISKSNLQFFRPLELVKRMIDLQ